MAKRNLSVEQFKQLMANLPKGVAGELQGAVDEAGQYLIRSMLFRVSRGDEGKLASSIRLERGRHPLRVLVRAGGPLTTKDGYDYALANEFGTEKMRAQAFFWPTYRAKKKILRSMISRRVKPALAKVVTIT